MAQRRIVVQVITPGRRETILDTKIGQPDAPPIHEGGLGGGVTAAPNQHLFTTVVQGFPTGLVGTVGVQVIDNVGGVTIARTTSGISEVSVLGAGSGIYLATLTAPQALGQYTVVWDKGSGGVTNVAVRDLVVS